MGASGSATLFGREPYTARERVESAGTDRRAQIAFGRGHEVGAQTVGTDCRVHARITVFVEQLRHFVISCSRFVP
jgi:hypothetical protein